MTKLTQLGFGLTAAVAAGRNDISVDVKTGIRDGTIWDLLDRLGPLVDLKWIYGDDRAELLAEWRRLADAVDEESQYGLRTNGLCLLISYLFEGVQQRTSGMQF